MGDAVGVVSQMVLGQRFGGVQESPLFVFRVNRRGEHTLAHSLCVL